MRGKLNYLQKTCDMIAAQCHAAYPALTVHFIIHEPGELTEAMAVAADKIKRHPAADSAHTILEKTPMMDRSSLLGIAMKTRRAFFGLLPRDRFLALININTEDVADMRIARHLGYHLAWHAISMMEYRRTPQAREKYQDGPMVPKRAPLGIALANMKADTFSAAMNFLQGDKKSLEELAHSRAYQSITPCRIHRVEDYPYIIAAEATQYALADIDRRGAPAANQLIRRAYGLSQEIGGQFAEQQIKQWQAFASPAQNMAWAGHAGEEILGAAVNTSEDPYIRATGYMVAEFTGISPLSASTMMTRYNSFTSFERNERLHKERMNSIFESALSRSLQEEQADTFRVIANEQNEQLAEGNVIGWCAGALQAAGETFGSSLSEGKSLAADKARTKFNDQKEKSDWETLSAIGDQVIEQKREGYAMTIAKVAELCGESGGYGDILASLQQTMQDPSYVRRLDAANDLQFAPAVPQARAAPHSPAPRGPAAAPKMASPAPAAPETPVIAAAPAGPSLGGSSSQMVRAKMLIQQKRLAEQQARETRE